MDEKIESVKKKSVQSLMSGGGLCLLVLRRHNLLAVLGKSSISSFSVMVGCYLQAKVDGFIDYSDANICSKH